MSQEYDLSVLTPKERQTYEKWLEAELPPISVIKALEFFELFCTGTTCAQIHKLNPQYELGAIIHARLRDKWDQKHDEYVAQMYDTIRDKVFQTQMESISFTTDLLAAAHKLHGEKIKKYLQTGDAKHLIGALRIDSLKQYKDGVELLLRSTGQDKQKENILPAPQQQRSNASSEVIDAEIIAQPARLNANQAGYLIRKQLEQKNSGS